MKTTNYKPVFLFAAVILFLMAGVGCLLEQAAKTPVQKTFTSTASVVISLSGTIRPDVSYAYPAYPILPTLSPAYPPPGSVQITYSVPTPSAIPPTVVTNTPAHNAIWVPLLDGYYNPASSELPPVSPPPWEAGMDRIAFFRSYVRAVTEMVNWTNGDTVAYLSDMQAWTSVDEEPIPVQIWSKVADMDGDGDMEIIASFPIIYEGQLNGPGTPIETYVMCGASLCFGQVLLFEQIDGMFLPVYRFGYNQTWEWLDMPQLATVQDLDGNGLSEIVMTESWCGASVCGKDLTVSQWDGMHWRILDSGKCPSEFMAVNSVQNKQSGFHVFCPELESEMVNDETN